MNCEHCCGADSFFDLKKARTQLKRYLKKGPLKSTKKLLEGLEDQNFNQKSLLDIGGGIGAISWHFLQQGGRKITDVDSSKGYIRIAKENADRNGWSDQCEFLFGDYAEISEKITNHDFVSLDKVVCCYPDYKLLLKASIEKCDQILALTFPLGGPIAEFLNLLSRLMLKMSKNPFRPFIHPPKAIRAFIVSSGFKPIHRSISFPWHVEIYHRISQ